MTVRVIRPPREDVLRCVARFPQLQRCDTGLPDMALEGCHRTFLNVLGFNQPTGEGQFSPFGDRAIAPISHLRAGFGVSFISARPGNGVLMHTHDTVESFMVMKGRWKIEWEGAEGTQDVTLEPLDFMALPVGVQRRFECLEAAPGDSEGLLLGIIGGDSPAAEISPEGIKALVDAGIFPREKLAA